MHDSTRSSHRIRGQGMSEYLVITALVAVATVAVAGFFGDAIRHQMAAMALKLAGDTSTAKTETTAAQTSAGNAKSDAGTAKTLQNFSQ